MLSVHFHAEKRRWSMSPFALFPSYNNIGWYPILSIIGTYNWSLTILCYSLIIIGIYDRLQRETWLKIEKLDSKGIKSVFLNFLKSRWTPTFNVLKMFFLCNNSKQSSNRMPGASGMKNFVYFVTRRKPSHNFPICSILYL